MFILEIFALNLYITNTYSIKMSTSHIFTADEPFTIVTSKVCASTEFVKYSIAASDHVEV